MKTPKKVIEKISLPLMLVTLVMAVLVFAVSPVSAAPDLCTDPDLVFCDQDGDTYIRDHKKCPEACGETLDPDDSDPCIFPDGEDVPANCDGSGEGGLGSNISMDCTLGASWVADPSADDSVDTIKDDRLGDYKDAVDKVDCSIRGPSIPWPIRLGVGGGKGKWANVRQVDINLGAFEAGSYTNTNPDNSPWVPDSGLLSGLYPNLFEIAPADLDHPEFPNMDQMDPLRLNVRPYRKDQTEGSIHLLTPGKSYEMGMRFTVPASTGSERFAVSIASQWYEGNEGFTGIACESGDEKAILANSPEQHSTGTENDDGPMRDVSVYLWLDGNDDDNLPDGYTVTTGEFTWDPEDPPFYGPPLETDINYEARWAAVCSAAGPKDCGNPQAPNNCNFLGYVKMQFTLHTMVK